MDNLLISLATMDFRLCHLLREKLTISGFRVEQILPGEHPSKRSILVVTTEQEESESPTNYPKKVILSQIETQNINQAYSRIILGIEGKKIWESLIIGVDPGLTIGIAIITDGCLRSTLETREIKEAVRYIISSLYNMPSKMSIIRIGSTGGYRRILLLNELLNVKPKDVALEVVDELQTTPASFQEAKNNIQNGSRNGTKIKGGKDATAAMEIAFRLGESVKCPEEWQVSEGELKEIQILSRQYSKGDVTISQELAKKVACGSISIDEAIRQHKSERKQEKN
ncbi:MAG TPA: hypothetical protein VMX55_05145 [candidate division Zixibacteria bacterium]|nr:hypothetical protein [candidate division Zixibacteria bacterium]